MFWSVHSVVRPNFLQGLATDPFMHNTKLSFTISINLILLFALSIEKVGCLSLPLVSIRMQVFCNTLILLLSS